MTPTKLIWKELWQRPTAMVTCLLAITLGVTALVAIRSISMFSEQAVAQQLETLGANVLLLPQTSTLADYYSADLQTATLPEEHAGRLALANYGRRRKHFAQAYRAHRTGRPQNYAHRNSAAANSKQELPGAVCNSAKNTKAANAKSRWKTITVPLTIRWRKAVSFATSTPTKHLLAPT